MKFVPFFGAAMLLIPVLEAGTTNCCRVRSCRPCGSGTSAVAQWYTAKDGTLRERIPYAAALSRAEDADDMEIELRGVRAELTTVAEQLDASARQHEALIAKLADFKRQLEEQVAATAAQKDRADKAEVALRVKGAEADELIAASNLAGKDMEEANTQLQEMRAARDDLLIQVTTLSEERERLNIQVNTAETEIERLKQEAIKNKKVAVATDDADAPKGEKAPAEEEPTDDERSEETPVAG